MLTSSSNNGNQYLRPEYLTPLPTTLDAKKSPLALLAQTCSQIGADPPSNTSSAAKSLLNVTTSSSGSSSAGSSTHHHQHESQHTLSKSKANKSHQQHDFHEKHRKPTSVSPITQDKSTRSSNGNAKSDGTSSSLSTLNESNGGNNISTSIFPSSVTITSNSNSGNGNGSVGNISDSVRHGSSISSYKIGASSKVIVSNPGNTSPNNNSSSSSSRASSSSSSSSCSATASANPTNKSPSASISPVTSNLGVGATNGGAADSTLSSSSSKTFKDSHSHSHAHTSSACNNNPYSANAAAVSSASSSSSTSSSLNNSSLTFNKLNLSNPAAAAGLLFPNSSASIELALRHGLFSGLYPPPHSSSSGQASGASGLGTGIPPYLHSYARLKAAAAGMANGSGNANLDPLLSLGPTHAHGHHSNNGCRDPFCGGCDVGHHNMKSCPSGCSQCDTHPHHNRNPFLSPFSFPLLPGFPLPPSLAGLYASHSGSSNSSLQPYICNWVVGGDSYCGKRFSSSEDLLLHLRTHTNLGSLSSATTQDTMQSLAAAAAAGYLPFPAHQSHPLLSSTNSHLNRTYPTPPLSPLGSNRFHPYAKHNGGSGGATSTTSSSGGSASTSLSSMGVGLGSAVPTSLSYLSSNFQGLGHPALSPYFPYSLYGQRLFGSSASSLHQ